MHFTTLAISSILSLGFGASAFPLQRRNGSLTDPTPQWCAPSVYGYTTLINAHEASELSFLTLFKIPELTKLLSFEQQGPSGSRTESLTVTSLMLLWYVLCL
jgi:hypothetical protein